MFFEMCCTVCCVTSCVPYPIGLFFFLFLLRASYSRVRQRPSLSKKIAKRGRKGYEPIFRTQRQARSRKRSVRVGYALLQALLSRSSRAQKCAYSCRSGNRPHNRNIRHGAQNINLGEMRKSKFLKPRTIDERAFFTFEHGTVEASCWWWFACPNRALRKIPACGPAPRGKAR